MSRFGKCFIVLMSLVSLVCTAALGNSMAVGAAGAGKVTTVTVRVGKNNVTKKQLTLKKGKAKN